MGRAPVSKAIVTMQGGQGKAGMESCGYAPGPDAFDLLNVDYSVLTRGKFEGVSQAKLE